MFARIIKIAEAPYQESEGSGARVPIGLGGIGAYSGFSLAKRRMQMAAERDLMAQANKVPFLPWISKARKINTANLIKDVGSPLRLLKHPIYGKDARRIALMYTLGLGGLGLFGGSMIKKNNLKRQQRNDFSNIQQNNVQ